jgi:hypothetical protein
MQDSLKRKCTDKNSFGIQVKQTKEERKELFDRTKDNCD